MNRSAKEFTDIFSKMVHACEKIQETQKNTNGPSFIPSKALSELFELIDSVHDSLGQCIANFSCIESKKKFSYDEVIVVVRSFYRGLAAIEKIIRALFDCIITISNNALKCEIEHKSKTVFHYQRQVIKKSIVTDPYKDIVMAICSIEFSFDRGLDWMMTFPANLDSLIAIIERMELEINFLIEGVTIVNSEKKFFLF